MQTLRYIVKMINYIPVFILICIKRSLTYLLQVSHKSTNFPDLRSDKYEHFLKEKSLLQLRDYIKRNFINKNTGILAESVETLLLNVISSIIMHF